MAMNLKAFVLGLTFSLLCATPTLLSSEHLTSRASLQCSMVANPVADTLYADAPEGDLHVWYATLRCSKHAPATYMSTTPVGPWVRF